jgi:hypothetical protein
MQVYGRSYDLGALTNVWSARSAVGVGVKVWLATLAAEVVLVGPIASVAPSSLMVFWSFTGVLSVLPWLLAWLCMRHWPSRYELWARYGGRSVIMFSTTDERQFGQVARALRRAIEADVEPEQARRTLAGD